MKNESIFRLIAIIAALHVVVLSVAFGLRHIGYVLVVLAPNGDSILPVEVREWIKASRGRSRTTFTMIWRK